MDIRTILLIACMNQLIVAIVMIALWKSNQKQVKGLGEWTINIWLQTLGHFFLATVGILPFFFSQLLASVLFVTGSVLFYLGLAKFTDTAYQVRYSIAYVLALTSALLFFSYILPDVQIRSVVFNASCVYMSCRYLMILWNNLHTDRFSTNVFWVLILLYITFALSNLIRIVMVLLGLLVPSTALGIPTMVFSSSLLISMMILMGVNFVILILINNSLVHALTSETFENTRLLTKMKILVEQDSLTGIMNRMAIENHLEKILAISRGAIDRCMVQIIDVDNFKEINDRYGHDAGDQVLIQLARIFSANIRDVDQVGRWGGDEFVIVFKGIAESAVQPMVQRIQGAVRDYDWSNILTASQAKVSISIGYTICEDKESKHDVLKRADDHLYTSKSHGRDCARGE